MYRICPDCGCALDPGEKCDCGGKAPQSAEHRSKPRMEYRTEGGIAKVIIYVRK